MRYLIDTNIISELRKTSPNSNVVNWIKDINPNQLFISCLTIGEIKMGIIKKSKKDVVAGSSLTNWLNCLCQEYKERIILINTEVCEKWGELLAKDSTNAIDALIAAQGAVNNMTLVTRNTKHFTKFSINLFNPFIETEEIRNE